MLVLEKILAIGLTNVITFGEVVGYAMMIKICCEI